MAKPKLMGLPARKTDRARERMTITEPLRLTRAEQVEQLRSEQYDIIIVGGGITGAYAAMDAALVLTTETLDANIRAVGLPAWSDADQTLARALQTELGVTPAGLASEIPALEPPMREPTWKSIFIALPGSYISTGEIPIRGLCGGFGSRRVATSTVPVLPLRSYWIATL